MGVLGKKEEAFFKVRAGLVYVLKFYFLYLNPKNGGPGQ
jgi:hypothetical protein